MLGKSPYMNIGVYQSAASLTALERWQDVTAQNVTASQVTGYRKRTVEFSGVEMGAIQANPSKNKISNSDTPQPLFPKATHGISFQHGENFPTQRPLDFAIEGEGFFELKRADGSLTYTREGTFHISPDRKLVSRDGFELLNADAVLRLDEALAQHNAALPRLAEFILPAGTRSAAPSRPGGLGHA